MFAMAAVCVMPVTGFAVDFPTAAGQPQAAAQASTSARAAVPTPMYQQPSFMDQSGMIQNVQSYSSNPFWNPTGPYNQRMPVPIYAQGSDLTPADCNAMVSYLVSAECGRRNNCSGLRVMDIKPAVTMALSAQSGQHNYLTQCSGYIDTAFSDYMANAQNVTASGFPTAFPAAAGAPTAAQGGPTLVVPTVTAENFLPKAMVAAAAGKAERTNQLAALQAQNDDGTPLLSAQKYPKTFEDLSFADQQAVLREGYEPWREKWTTVNGLRVCIENCPYQTLNIESDEAMWTRKANEAGARATMLTAMHDADFCAWCKQVPETCLSEQQTKLDDLNKKATATTCTGWNQKDANVKVDGWKKVNTADPCYQFIDDPAGAKTLTIALCTAAAATAGTDSSTTSDGAKKDTGINCDDKTLADLKSWEQWLNKLRACKAQNKPMSECDISAPGTTDGTGTSGGGAKAGIGGMAGTVATVGVAAMIGKYILQAKNKLPTPGTPAVPAVPAGVAAGGPIKFSELVGTTPEMTAAVAGNQVSFTVAADGKSLLYGGAKVSELPAGTTAAAGTRLPFVKNAAGEYVNASGTRVATPGTAEVPATPGNPGTPGIARAANILGKVSGTLMIIGGVMGVIQATSGTGPHDWGDVMSGALNGATAGLGASMVFGPIGWVEGTIGGAVIGSISAGSQLFSETDCQIDPKLNVFTCCHTEFQKGARWVDIGGQMFCEFPMIRKCLQCPNNFQASCSDAEGSETAASLLPGSVRDDFWAAACTVRYCDGWVAPQVPANQIVPIGKVEDGESGKVCWQWECADGRIRQGGKCVDAVADTNVYPDGSIDQLIQQAQNEIAKIHAACPGKA